MNTIKYYGGIGHAERMYTAPGPAAATVLLELLGL